MIAIRGVARFRKTSCITVYTKGVTADILVDRNPYASGQVELMIDTQSVRLRTGDGSLISAPKITDINTKLTIDFDRIIVDPVKPTKLTISVELQDGTKIDVEVTIQPGTAKTDIARAVRDALRKKGVTADIPIVPGIPSTQIEIKGTATSGLDGFMIKVDNNGWLQSKFVNGEGAVYPRYNTVDSW